MSSDKPVKYACLIEKEGKNYSAYIKEMPLVLGTGRSKFEAVRSLSESLQFYLKSAPLMEPIYSQEDLRREQEADNLQIGLDENEIDSYEIEYGYVSPAENDPISMQIDRALKAEDITHNQLAQKLNIPRSSVTRLASPYYHRHNIDSLRNIADALGYRLEVRLIKE